MVFIFFSLLGKNVFEHQNYKNFFLSVIGTHPPLLFFVSIVCGGLYTMPADPSGWDRDHMACKTNTIYGSFY